MRHLSTNGIRPHESGKVPGQCVFVWPCQRYCACAKVCSFLHKRPAAVQPLRVKPSLPPKSCRRPLPLFPLTQLSCVLPHNPFVHFKFLFRCHHCPCTVPFSRLVRATTGGVRPLSVRITPKLQLLRSAHFLPPGCTGRVLWRAWSFQPCTLEILPF